MISVTAHPTTAAIGTLRPPHPAASARVTEAALRSSQRRRIARADLLGIAVWASAAISIALWLTAAPLTLSSLGAVLTDAGIATGLIGTDLILVMIVLAARIPVIERAVGHDGAMAVHRSIGKPALYLLLAHAVLLVIGYAATDHTSWLAETLSLLTISDLVLGTFGLLGIVAVVVTSVVAVRRLLPYEGWHAIHLLSYVAVLIALPHQLSMGGMLAEGMWQRTYWILLYVAALGAVAWFRFTVPAIRSIRHGVIVDRVEPIGPDVVSLWLRGRELDALGARGGQFFVWRFWTGATWWHAHPLSLSATPTGTRARLTMRVRGTGTARLARLRPGTRVSFAGPYGIFTDAARSSTRVAVAASGIGVTAVHAFLEHLDAPPGSVTVVLRARTERETYLWHEIGEWGRVNGATVYASVGPRGSGAAAWLSDRDCSRGATARSIWPELADSDLYLCGPDGWSDLVEADGRRAGLHPLRLHRERFAW